MWLCSDHATLIDKNRGVRFPAALLLSYKDLTEAQVHRAQTDIHSPMGWFHELVIHESPIFAEHTRIRFGKLTVVVGNNASGKTAICEWLSGLTDPAVLWRWNPPKRKTVRLELTYFDPTRQNARVEISQAGTIQYFVNGKQVPFYPWRMGIVRLPNFIIQEHNAQDEVELVSDILSVHPSIIRNLIPRVNEHNEGCLEDVRVENQCGTNKLMSHWKDDKRPYCFRLLSGSQQSRLLIELSVAIASFSSEFMPTILMLDGVNTLDPSNFARYADYLSAPNHHFQTIMLLVRSPRATGQERWAGWESVRFLGTEAGVTVDQSPV